MINQEILQKLSLYNMQNPQPPNYLYMNSDDYETLKKELDVVMCKDVDFAGCVIVKFYGMLIRIHGGDIELCHYPKAEQWKPSSNWH